MSDNDDLLRAWTLISRREHRARVAQQLAVIKAAQRAGLPVRKATIDGVDIEFGQSEEAGHPAALVTELDQWIAKHHARAS